MRQQRRFRRRIRHRRQEAEDLVEVDQRAQARGAALAAHPADDLVEQQRDEEHPLLVVEMRDRDHADARTAVLGRRAGDRCRAARLRARRRSPARPAAGSTASPARSDPSTGRTIRDRRTPTLAIGGDWICVISAGRSRSRPARQLSVKSVASSDVLAAAHRLGIDAGERQHARGGRRHAILQQVGVVDDFRVGRRKRFDDRQRPARASCPAYRARTPPLRAAARCARRPGPTRPGPSTISPLRRPQTPRRSVRPDALRPASTHGEKSAAASLGKVSSRLPRSPFGSIAITGTPSIARFFDQVDAEAGLAAAGHAGDHARA